MTLLQRSQLTEPSQMLSDERLEKVERFVSESLNEDASLQKVCPHQALIMIKASQRLFFRPELARPTLGCTL